MADPAPAAPPSPSPAPAAQPGSLTGVRYDAPISDAQFDRLGPQEQSRFARVRDEANNSRWQPRSDLDPAVAPKRAAAQPGDTPPAPAAPPASVTEDGKLRVGDYELSADDIAALMQTKAQADLRATQIPPNAEGYQATLPDGFKLPEGVSDFKFNDADPALRDMRAWAHGKGIDQKTFSEMLGFYAASEAGKEATFRAAQAREVEKLGVMGTTRVTAVETWLRAQVGDELANAMRPMIVTAKIVEGFERIAARHTSQGAASYSNAHRAPPEPGGRVSDEEYGRMSQAERWEYARGFDQKQFKANGGE